MSRVDLVVECEASSSMRARQLEAIFDVPRREKQTMEWHGEVPLEGQDWNVGLIVGPSGAGKSSVARQLFGAERVDRAFSWAGKSVLDDFADLHSIEEIADVCKAVGFNTIPAWLRPHAVLSTGEKFRVDLARRLLEQDDPIVVDEFTSVVDRQVAQIGSHAVQKYVRAQGRKFVAVGCHYDVIEWLQPDWVLEPATMSFQRRSLQRRPPVDVEVTRVEYEAWHTFAPFHYMSADLGTPARCFALFVGGRMAAFAGVLYRMHPKVQDVAGVSRLVTLPDFQGLGLAPILVDKLGALFKGIGMRLHTYPAHPALIRGFDKSPVWAMVRKPGFVNGTVASPTGKKKKDGTSGFGGRPCAVFEYVGPAVPFTEAAPVVDVPWGRCKPAA